MEYLKANKGWPEIETVKCKLSILAPASVWKWSKISPLLLHDQPFSEYRKVDAHGGKCKVFLFYMWKEGYLPDAKEVRCNVSPHFYVYYRQTVYVQIITLHKRTPLKRFAYATVAAALSEFDGISTLKEQQRTALKDFLYSWLSLARLKPRSGASRHRGARVTTPFASEATVFTGSRLSCSERAALHKYSQSVSLMYDIIHNFSLKRTVK